MRFPWVFCVCLVGLNYILGIAATDEHRAIGAEGPVSLYMSEEAGVLDLSWDDAPRQLQVQLSELGFSAVAAVRPPGVPGSGAYIIPVQNGASFYSSSEDMGAIASFVDDGGLVVVLDAKDGEGAALRSFVAKALGYQGKRSHIGSSTDVHSRCLHEDASAVSWPLYTVLDDPDMVVAQAFGRVGSPGAVVWLGYSWKDGPQAEWGAMLRTLIEAFGTGAYRVPQQGNDAAQWAAAADRVVAEVFMALRDSSFSDPDAAGAPPLLLSLAAFAAAGGKKAPADVYLVGAYDGMYQLDYVQRAVLDFVAAGNGLVVVGPDVLPPIFYPEEDDADYADYAGDGGGRRRRVQEGEGVAAGGGWTPWVPGAGGGARRRGAAGGRGRRRRRLLQQGAAFNGSNVDVAAVMGTMGLLFSSDVTNGGGNVSLDTPSPLSNALIATQQLVLYKQGQLTLAPTELALAQGTLLKARSSTLRSSPGASAFWAAVDAIDSFQALPPPSPPPPAPSPREGLVGDEGASPGALCYNLNASGAVFVRLGTLRPPVGRDACASLVAAGLAGKSYPVIGLQGSSCFAARDVLPAVAQAAQAECSGACMGTPGQTCGNIKTGMALDKLKAAEAAAPRSADDVAAAAAHLKAVQRRVAEEGVGAASLCNGA
ncbi:hypothetical protein TSOC_011359 [Tetrabaena socialis]|uniref:WSC domain-containing protein n=1 Tax=Tetrabaena socialis TaxID=47790 RepID=A0A2J7ZQV9_9CHLO|nr:hypothetical protein TSOC_011359 [Tetrabaena socialis]|eukprot:PNH02647.1 hypothetical protein TSOC_011359 [Tetrabaena socialis]